MNIDEFEKSVDTLTVTNDFANTPWISNEIGVEHYGYENTKSDKPFVFSKGYPTFRLHYIVRGKLLLSVHGKNIHLKTGQCFFAPSGREYRLQNRPFTTGKLLLGIHERQQL